MVLQASPKSKVRKIRLQELRRLLGFLKPHKVALTIGFLALMLGAATNLLLPQLVRGFIDAIGNTAGKPRWSLWNLVAITVVVFAVQGAAFYLRARQFGSVSHRIAGAIRAALYSGVLQRSAVFFDNHRSGDLASRLSSEVALVQDAVGIRITVLVRYGVQVVVGTVLMGLVSTKLTIALICALVALVVIGAAFARSLRRASKALNAEIGTLTGLFTEALSGVRFLQAHSSVGWMTAKLDALNVEAVGKGEARVLVSSVFQSFVSFLLNSALVLLGVYGIILVSTGELGAGAFGAFVSYAAIVAVSFSFLVASISEVSQALGAWERIVEVLPEAQSSPHTLSQSSPAKTAPISGAEVAEIRFENVTFRYGSQTPPALRELSFTISSGQRVALVGRSGSGKSTVLSLLLGFYEPTSGAISVKQRGAGSATELDSLSGLVAYVPQDPQLFGLSIRDNLLVTAPNASDEQLISALKRARLGDLFTHGEGGELSLNTVIGERGLSLSTGQRQRLALARAFLSNAKVILLDEPTANLDAENEKAVQDALAELFEGRTTITVAHKFSTIMKSDLVLVLDSGALVESGAPSKLMASNGVFHHLASLQQTEQSPGSSR